MRNLFIALAILPLLSCCSKFSRCKGADENKGIIDSGFNFNCLPDANGQVEFVIDHDSTYQKLFKNAQPSCTLPKVDFANTTILGKRAQGNCELKFVREVNRIEAEKRYHYKIIVYSCGTCKSLGYSYNWVAVPKLPADWRVTFETVDK